MELIRDKNKFTIFGRPVFQNTEPFVCSSYLKIHLAIRARSTENLRAPVSTFLFSVIALSDVKHIHFSPKKAHHQVSASAFFISSVLGLNRASIGFDKDGPHYHGLGGRSAWGCEMPRGCFVFRHRRFKDPTLEGERDFVAVRRRSEFSFPISRLQPPFTGRLESRSNPSSLKHTWFKNGEIRVVFFVTNKDSND